MATLSKVRTTRQWLSLLLLLAALVCFGWLALRGHGDVTSGENDVLWPLGFLFAFGAAFVERV